MSLISAGGGRQPMWRRDGRELFFVTNDRKFYAVDVRAGATFEFQHTALSLQHATNTISVATAMPRAAMGSGFW